MFRRAAPAIALVSLLLISATVPAQELTSITQFGTSSYDEVWGVAIDGSGVYLGGQTRGTLPGQVSAGDKDAFVRKVDADGNEVWTRQFGTADWDFGSNVEANASGVYVVGTTDGGFPGQTDRRRSDAFLRKYEPGGSPARPTSARGMGSSHGSRSPEARPRPPVSPAGSSARPGA